MSRSESSVTSPTLPKDKGRQYPEEACSDPNFVAETLSPDADAERKISCDDRSAQPERRDPAQQDSAVLLPLKTLVPSGHQAQYPRNLEGFLKVISL
jgi:hypothetical protein